MPVENVMRGMVRALAMFPGPRARVRGIVLPESLYLRFEDELEANLRGGPLWVDGRGRVLFRSLPVLRRNGNDERIDILAMRWPPCDCGLCATTGVECWTCGCPAGRHITTLASTRTAPEYACHGCTGFNDHVFDPISRSQTPLVVVRATQENETPSTVRSEEDAPWWERP